MKTANGRAGRGLFQTMLRFLLLALLTCRALAAPENLLRNGSFEGGLLYWHQIDPKNDTLVRDAAVGEFALRIAKGNVMSAPFVAVRGAPVTVSFFVKGEKPGRVGVQMPPSAREPGQKAKRLWMREAEQSAEIGTEWKRVSFTWLADVPPDGFWPNPHYLVQIGGHDSPILIDGVTVTVGKEGTPKYVPRTVLEAVVECPSLRGYAENGNILEAGQPVTMVAHISNAALDSGQPCHFQWFVQDYEGKLLWSSPDEWAADDARWDDLKIETAWDKFVKAAALHFKGRSIVFEIENEPEFDHWDKFKTEYAKFTIRTARLLRATDPAAKIMVNNVYGIPSGLNAEFFKMGGLAHIDVMSWHDYHEGWLADAQGIRRMRQSMDEAGGKNVELWFNEGWA